MPYDSDRARALIARAAFNAELWRGTVQDLSSVQRAMVINGTLRFVPYGSVVGVTMRTAADYAYRDNVPALVDATASFSLETLVYPCNGIAERMMYHLGVGASGAWAWLTAPPAGPWIIFWDAVGAFARSIQLPAGSLPLNKLTHLLIVPSAGATAGKALRFYSIGSAGGGGLLGIVINRIYPFTLGNEDAQVLYQQAKILTGGAV